MKEAKFFTLSTAFVIYLIFMNLLYLYNDYVGFLMNIIIGSMVLVILIISIIAEFVQKSKTNRTYFWGLTGCVLAAFACLFLLKYDLSQIQ